VAAASVAILHTHALPSVLGLIGFPVAAGLAAAWYYLPLLALLAWILAVSLLLCFRSPHSGVAQPGNGSSR
jgi:hypothetical protein